MITPEQNRFERLVSKWCPDYHDVLGLLVQAEAMIRTIRNNPSFTLKCFFGYENQKEFGDVATFIVSTDESILLKKDYQLGHVNLEFQKAAAEVWLTNVNILFKQVKNEVFGIGINQLSRIVLKTRPGGPAIAEEEDIYTL